MAEHIVSGLACDFSFAFQPIVDVSLARTVSHEALLRGPQQQPAPWILARVPACGGDTFFQHTRNYAIQLAMSLGLRGDLNVNFLPHSARGSDEPIRATLAAAEAAGLSLDRLVIEITEGEMISDPVGFAHLINGFRESGVRFAIDDFGAGYAGLNLLADFQPDTIKLDMNLARGIESRGPRQAIVRALARACMELGIDMVAEGIETVDEYAWFVDQGVSLFQGYLFARPAFESFPEIRLPVR